MLGLYIKRYLVQFFPHLFYFFCSLPDHFFACDKGLFLYFLNLFSYVILNFFYLNGMKDCPICFLHSGCQDPPLKFFRTSVCILLYVSSLITPFSNSSLSFNNLDFNHLT